MQSAFKLKAYTDYPLLRNQSRDEIICVNIVGFDGDKYVDVICDDNGVYISRDIKWGYLFKDKDLIKGYTYGELKEIFS